MPARTGRQYLDGLRAQEREVWLAGERVRDVTTHPGLARGAQAVARLYDMQHDPELRNVMTYASPSSGEPVGRSFDMPKTREALETRRRMMLELGARDLRHDGAIAGFHERDVCGLGRRRRLFRRETSGIRRQHAALCGVYPRERRHLDPFADQSATQPQPDRHVQSGRGNCASGDARDRYRDRRSRRTHPGDARSVIGRDRGLFAAAGATARGKTGSRSASRSPAARRA